MSLAASHVSSLYLSFPYSALMPVTQRFAAASNDPSMEASDRGLGVGGKEVEHSSLAIIYRANDAFQEKSKGKYWEVATKDAGIIKGSRTYRMG